MFCFLNTDYKTCILFFKFLFTFTFYVFLTTDFCTCIAFSGVFSLRLFVLLSFFVLFLPQIFVAQSFLFFLLRDFTLANFVLPPGFCICRFASAVFLF